jgi:ubiquinone/menaquinone biosynthesis C-methylase UbiE
VGEFSRGLIERSGYAREGFPAHYDAYRPRPPRILLETLCRIAQVERPPLVVDLGAGTGLSTREWSVLADRVVGVEPNTAMFEEARRATAQPNVAYVNAFAQETPLEDACGDIVTCSQSLHWMEPEPTFAEAARILRAGGVFAAYDYDPAPLVDSEVDEAYDAYLRRRRAARERRGISSGGEVWPKQSHLDRMRASGRFRYCRQLAFHAIVPGSAASLVGFARSIGLSGDATEEELGLPELEEAAKRILGDREVPFQWSYFVRYGVK